MWSSQRKLGSSVQTHWLIPLFWIPAFAGMTTGGGMAGSHYRLGYDPIKEDRCRKKGKHMSLLPFVPVFLALSFRNQPHAGGC